MNGYYGKTRINGICKNAHTVIAENALGKRLPLDAEVHHWNKNKLDNRPENLVICPDRTYHRLLHLRQNALEACGNPEYRKCTFCKAWSHPSVMRKRRDDKSFHHLVCRDTYARKRYLIRKAKLAEITPQLADGPSTR
jgi:hypothetical protein